MSNTAKSYRQHPNSRVFLDIFIEVRDQNETKLYHCRSVFKFCCFISKCSYFVPNTVKSKVLKFSTSMTLIS